MDDVLSVVLSRWPVSGSRDDAVSVIQLVTRRLMTENVSLVLISVETLVIVCIAYCKWAVRELGG